MKSMKTTFLRPKQIKATLSGETLSGESDEFLKSDEYFARRSFAQQDDNTLSWRIFCFLTKISPDKGVNVEVLIRMKHFMNADSILCLSSQGKFLNLGLIIAFEWPPRKSPPTQISSNFTWKLSIIPIHLWFVCNRILNY